MLVCVLAIIIFLFPTQKNSVLKMVQSPMRNLSASSNYISSRSSTPAGGRLNKLPDDGAIGGWHPSVADTNQWIEVDLSNSTYVTGVLTQGRSGGPAGQWVTMYKVQYEPPSPACLVDVKDQLGQTQVC